MDNFWKSIENSEQVDISVEILNVTYLDRDENVTMAKEIESYLDEWTYGDIEAVIMMIVDHPHYEDGLERSDIDFGSRNYLYESDFFEAATIRDAPFDIWNEACNIRKRSKRKNFF